MLLIFAAYLPTADFAAHVDPWRRSARSPFGCSCRRSRPVGRRSSWQISVRVLGLICCATACCGALRRSPGDGSQPVPEHPQPGHPDCPARPSGRWLPQSGRCIGVPIRAGFGPGLRPGGYSRWCLTSVLRQADSGRSGDAPVRGSCRWSLTFAHALVDAQEPAGAWCRSHATDPTSRRVWRRMVAGSSLVVRWSDGGN